MEEKNLKGLFGPGLYNGLQKISIPLFGVLSTALLAHKALSKIEMGVWVNFLAVTTFVEMFRSGIVRTSLIKFINHSKSDEHSSIMSAAFILNAIISLIAGLILLFFGKDIEEFLKSPGLASMLYFYLATMVFLVFFSHMEWLMYAHLRFKALFITYVVRQGSTFLFFLLYYLFASRVYLDMLVVLYTVGVILGLVAGYLSMKHLFQLTIIFSGHWMSTLWNFGKFVFGSNIFTLIFRNSDQLLLSNISANPGMVASQNISMRVINIADIPSQVIADILFPKNSRHADHPHINKVNYEKAVGAALCAVIPIVLFILLFPKLIIAILVGSKYYDAIPYLTLISSVIIFQTFLKQTGVIFDSSGHPKVSFFINLFLAVIQIGACYFFINRYQLMGAGYALLLSHLIGFVLSQVLLKRFFNINFINCFRYCIEFYPVIFKTVLIKVAKKNTTINEK